MLRDIVKKIWKSISPTLIRLYTWNFSLYIENNPRLPIPGSYSQFGQDKYVLEKIFNNKKEGVFVDVGGNHPVNGSNTYLLEQNAWTGIAIEPQERLRNLWKNTRTTPCLNYVIGPENKKVCFVEGLEEDGLSGVAGFNKVSKTSREIEVEQIRLSDLLNRYNFKHIDYISIDVEGYEMHVLNSIDFERYNIMCIEVENNLGFSYLPIIGNLLGHTLGKNSLRRYLKDKGFKQIARIMGDDIFIKNNEQN